MRGTLSSRKDKEEGNVALADQKERAKNERDGKREKKRQTEQTSGDSSWRTDEPSRSHRSLVYIHQGSHS